LLVFAFVISAISVVKDLGRKFAMARHHRQHAGRVRSPEFALFPVLKLGCCSSRSFAFCAGRPASSIPDSDVENFVTILGLILSFAQSVHRYGKFESAQIRKGVAGSGLSWLCAF
jgi:hypothetical protein